jgi:hypothetical protein
LSISGYDFGTQRRRRGQRNGCWRLIVDFLKLFQNIPGKSSKGKEERHRAGEYLLFDAVAEHLGQVVEERTRGERR